MLKNLMKTEWTISRLAQKAGRESLMLFLLKAGETVVFDFSHFGHALVTLYVQFLCSDWSKFDR